MSRSLSISTAIEKSKLDSATPFLVTLDISVINPATGTLIETLYLVNNTEAITFAGHTYTPFKFTIELEEESGAQPEVQLVISDYTNVVQQRMQLYGGGVGFPVTVMIVNTSSLTSPPEIQEFFEVTGASSQNYDISFTLGAESALSKRFPRRRQMRDFCPWNYKGAECKYSGSLPTCDLTLNGANGCAIHQNTVNFGGFPGISAGARYG